MAVLQLNDEQVIELVRQLSAEKQMQLVQTLLQQSRNRWVELSNIGQVGVRRAASDRGRDWEAMNEDEREDFINDLIHEDRMCS